MPSALTAKQEKILRFIQQEVASTNCVPSQAEIGRHFGHRSPNATRQNLLLIEKKGYIKILPGVTRGIRLLPPLERSPHSVPLIGRIAAGNPILAEENAEDWIQLPEMLFPDCDDRFALRVEGDSMIGAGILNHDIAVIRKDRVAETGEIAAVRINEEATLKRLEFYDGGLRLRPENPAYEAIEISKHSGNSCEIEGVLEGILRTCSKGGMS